MSFPTFCVFNTIVFILFECLVRKKFPKRWPAVSAEISSTHFTPHPAAFSAGDKVNVILILFVERNLNNTQKFNPEILFIISDFYYSYYSHFFPIKSVAFNKIPRAAYRTDVLPSMSKNDAAKVVCYAGAYRLPYVNPTIISFEYCTFLTHQIFVL